MHDAIDRICREAGVPDLLAILCQRIPASDLQTLLLEVFRTRAADRTPADLLLAATNGYASPSGTPPALAAKFDRLAFATADGFSALELSPVSPLGTVSVVTRVSQDKALAAVKHLEVVSDCTNVLALQCALRRRAGKDSVRLCASHRVVRPTGKRAPGDLVHFRLFGMCTAGKAGPSLTFEEAALIEHIGIHVTLLQAWLPGSRIRVTMTDFSGKCHDPLRALLDQLSSSFPGCIFEEDEHRTRGQGYYSPLAFEVFCGVLDTEYSVSDGGFTDWTQQLLSNRKERLLISGVGAERLCGLKSLAAKHQGD